MLFSLQLCYHNIKHSRLLITNEVKGHTHYTTNNILYLYYNYYYCVQRQMKKSRTCLQKQDTYIHTYI